MQEEGLKMEHFRRMKNTYKRNVGMQARYKLSLSTRENTRGIKKIPWIQDRRKNLQIQYPTIRFIKCTKDIYKNLKSNVGILEKEKII
jgi:hypothetical protein